MCYKPGIFFLPLSLIHPLLQILNCGSGVSVLTILLLMYTERVFVWTVALQMSLFFVLSMPFRCLLRHLSCFSCSRLFVYFPTTRHRNWLIHYFDSYHISASLSKAGFNLSPDGDGLNRFVKAGHPTCAQLSAYSCHLRLDPFQFKLKSQSGPELTVAVVPSMWSNVPNFLAWSN